MTSADPMNPAFPPSLASVAKALQDRGVSLEDAAATLATVGESPRTQEPIVAMRRQLEQNGDQLQVVKIFFPGGAPAPQIAQELSTAGRAEVYGIYFDFASDRIRPESEPALQEIANAMTTNPSWSLNVEGHTDNIGGDAYNQALSERRAAAVKKALVDQYHIGASRLKSIGYGATRPKDSNNTLEGRARNRRVELLQ